MAATILSNGAHSDPSYPPSSSPSNNSPQCAFHPQNYLTPSHSISHHPILNPNAIPTNTYTNIPSHAWPHITSLLLSHSTPLFSGPALARNSVQTLRLSSLSSDAALENIVLGMVFTAPPSEEKFELRSVAEVVVREKVEGRVEVEMREELVGEEGLGMGEVDERKCVEEAIRGVEQSRQVEGELVMGGRGKVGFLVYRVD
ncbi:hypothetical protein EG329_003528 [Mollisiaceae sp. DMI_Dod_QoI]|nr:hypothetical protein EG329_003528 [Helotiales sp. DMI_Dod_QoI]